METMNSEQTNTEPGGVATGSQLESQKFPLYNADANQRIPMRIEDGEFVYEVAYIMGPQKDDSLAEYDRRCDRRFASADAKEAGERNALESTDDSFGAALWLFNDRLVDVEGFGESDEQKPENWRELIGTDLDKAAVIDNAYLAADIAAARLKEGKRHGWGAARQEASVTRVRALFEGYELTLAHERSRPPTADHLAEFKSIMKHRFLVEGSRRGKTDTRIPPKARRLGALYDKLGYSTTGYEGRVPLHHKMLVVIHDLTKESESVRKN